MKTLRRRRLRWLPAMVLLSLMGIAAGSAFAEVSERLISLDIQEQPLKKVLQQIAGQTGYTFLFENTWSEHPVSVRLRDATIQTGLRRVLGRVNHALVYLPNRTIRILITETSPPHGGGSTATRPARARKPFISEPAPPPAQEPEPPVAPEQTGQAEGGGAVEAADATENRPAAN